MLPSGSQRWVLIGGAVLAGLLLVALGARLAILRSTTFDAWTAIFTPSKRSGQLDITPLVLGLFNPVGDP